MGYAIGTVTKSGGGGIDCHVQMLGIIKTLAEANGWSTAVRGSWTSGNVWVATVTVPSSGSFSWKAMKGPYSAGTSTSTGTSGMVWESGANHAYPSTTEITVSF